MKILFAQGAFTIRRKLLALLGVAMVLAAIDRRQG